ncbi:MAG TPA: PQQ-binding-like beta-propeller repeat protein [Methylomirabilota bacterium]|nr:PQQ-binding-like beta-propeller repeat protein [Methylomirabilota bacterium]
MNTKSISGWLAGLALVAANGVPAANWPAWRFDGSGIAPEKSAPVKWSKSENVRWRAPLPEPGNSSPIIWGDRVFLGQATGAKRELMCVDRRDGKVLWQAGASYEGKDPTHDTNPYASPTPVTDGERIIMWFGSAGLYCYDFDGKEVWRRDLGKQEHQWGYGSSPILYEDLCILNFGPGPRTFLIALNKKTGEKVWQVDLPENDPPVRYDGFAGKKGQPIGSWSTPLLVKAGNRTDLVLSIVGELRGFEPKTGREVWKADGLSPLVYTSAIAGEGVIVGAGGFSGSTVAIKAGGRGDLSNQKLWFVQKEKKNRISSGVISKGHVFLCNMDGVAQCIELATGKEKWNERLKATAAKGEIWGSTVLVGDNVYVINQSGDTFVFKANPEKLELVATNPLNEMSNATPAVSNGEIFIRTHQALWCISEKNSERASR